MFAKTLRHLQEKFGNVGRRLLAGSTFLSRHGNAMACSRRVRLKDLLAVSEPSVSDGKTVAKNG